MSQSLFRWGAGIAEGSLSFICLSSTLSHFDNQLILGNVGCTTIKQSTNINRTGRCSLVIVQMDGTLCTDQRHGRCSQQQPAGDCGTR